MSTILLADDNPHARRMGSEILGDEGYDVVAVENGDEAMAHLNAHQTDLLLADTEMPGAGGYDLCGFVRSQPTLGHVKVVLLQPPLERFDEQRAAEVGSDGVLHKPLDAAALIETVARLIENSGVVRDPKIRPKRNEFVSKKLDAAKPTEPGSEEPQRPNADPFAAAVEEALSEPRPELRDEIRLVVAEVLEAATPALVDRITERVLESIRKT